MDVWDYWISLMRPNLNFGVGPNTRGLTTIDYELINHQHVRANSNT